MRRISMEQAPRLLTRWLFALAAIFLAVRFVPSAGLAMCLGASIYSLMGARQSVESLIVLAFLIILGGSSVALGRWLVLAAVFGRILWDGVLSDAPVPPVIYPIGVFAVTAGVFALVSSRFPVVSILKIVAFVLGVGVTLIGMYRTRHLRNYWLSVLFTLGAFILIASIPMYFTGGGYIRTSSAFQGILTHPQTFGPVLAPITALFTGLYLFNERRSWLIHLCIVMGWVGMYMSLSRTSLLAAVLSLLLTAGIGFMFKYGTWGVKIGRALARPGVIVALVGICGIAIVQWTDLQNTIQSFLLKDDEAASMTQILEESRGSRIARSMQNFREQPLTGIGFGVPSDPGRMARQLETGPMGLPIGASVEKGFMPSAVLEETGLVGAFLVVILLVYLVAPVLRQPDPTLFWMMAASLFINFGEMIFFSVGGMGAYFWIVMALCYVTAVNLNAPTAKYSRTTAAAA